MGEGDLAYPALRTILLIMLLEAFPPQSVVIWRGGAGPAVVPRGKERCLLVIPGRRGVGRAGAGPGAGRGGVCCAPRRPAATGTHTIVLSSYIVTLRCAALSRVGSGSGRLVLARACSCLLVLVDACAARALIAPAHPSPALRHASGREGRPTPTPSVSQCRARHVPRCRVALDLRTCCFLRFK